MLVFARAGDLPQPPVAKIVPKTLTIHGHERIDNYQWLRERDNAEVLQYLEAENAYTEAVMKSTGPLQARLYEEITSRIKQTDLSVPTRIDNFYYYTRTFEGKNYPVHCRKKGSLDAAEEILLDVNACAEGKKYYRVAVFRVSPDHRLLAYSDDTEGDETYTLRFKDLNTGAMLPDTIANIDYSVEWANDNRTVYYATLDAARRPHKLHRHVLGDPVERDALLYHETDETFRIGLSKSRSRKFLILNLDSTLTTEVRVLSADAASGAFAVVEPRKRGHEYHIEHHGERFFIVTNDDARNFRLMETPTAVPGRSHWKEVIPHREKVKLDDVDAFADHLLIRERDEGLPRLRIRKLADDSDHMVEFDEPAYAVFPTGNEEFKTDTLRFMYQSLITPRSVYDYNMNTRKSELLKRDEVLGGYEPNHYVSERVFATAADGTRVPINLAYRKGLTRDGKNPMLLNAYGSYGASMDTFFSADRISLLDRGFVFALANIRGGGELGRPWYEDGKLLKKKNTFTDFIACAEHLIAEKYTAPDRLAIQGGSAGGLLMGAVTNMRPDLFKVVIAHVPFVDVINTMLDPSIPLTTLEYDEWGNPNDKTYYEYMFSYSPYDNVAAKAYPNILVKTGLNDPRVAYWEPAKWVARLRAAKTDNNRLLLKTRMEAGHGGASGRYDRWKDTAFDYAFILDTLNIRDAESVPAPANKID
ncbi:MAG: S9 family peptidase [Planctomycetota bacterium]